MGAKAAANMELDRTNSFTQGYADACKEVAQELGLPVIDLWTGMQQGEVRVYDVRSGGAQEADACKKVAQHLRIPIIDTWTGMQQGEARVCDG